ncbi:MAG: hypothetical protein ACTSX6_12700 [Candidatus Heimdallarchaeaceae archaeon]
MFQVVTRRDKEIGYHICLSDIPKELSEDSIVFMPEVATKRKTHLKYISKYTHKSGHIIVKLVKSDGIDPFGRPKALAHSLIIPSEEYNFNSLYYYASPIINSYLFEDTDEEPKLLNESFFKKSKLTVADSIERTALRNLVVAAMIEKRVIIRLNMGTEKLIQLASIIDKAIPYEASYDFSLITFSDKRSRKFLVHNVLYELIGEDSREEKIEIKNLTSKVAKIAEEEKKYLDLYIDLILQENYEKLLEEHAKWVIGIYYNEYKNLQKLFRNRYQLDMPFSRRNKFHAKLAKSLSSFYY